MKGLNSRQPADRVTRSLARPWFVDRASGVLPWLAIVLGLFGTLSVGPGNLWGQDQAGLPTALENSRGVRPVGGSLVRVGIADVYRVGQWTGVRWTGGAAAAAGNSGTGLEILETLDPDGVRVRFEQPTDASATTSAAASGASLPWGYAVPGSATAPLRVLDRAGEVLWEGRFSGQAIEPVTPWVVAIGDPLGVDGIGRNELLGRDSTVAVSQVTAAAELPDRLAGWEGVDLLIITPRGMSVLAGMDTPRVAALVSWVREGGRLLVSLGGDGGDLLAANEWLASLIGIEPGAAVQRLDPAPLETYAASTVPLATLDGYPLPVEGGRTLIPGGRTTTRQPARLAFERIVGLGRISVTSFGLHTDALADWPDRLPVITRMLPGLLDGDTDRRREVRARSAVAYEDLAGQIHTALDRFDSHRRLPFSVVSLILLGLIAIVGPLDYWLIRQWLGKPLLGWLSFPVSVVAVSCLVVALGGAGRNVDQGPRIGRIEIVDIGALTEQRVARVIGLTHLSSGPATRLDFPGGVTPTWAAIAGLGSPGLGQPQSDQTATDPTDTRSAGEQLAEVPTLTRTHGYPGSAYGGILIVGENRTLPAYRVALAASENDQTQREQPSDSPAAIDVQAAKLVGQPRGFPLPPAGSKSWLTHWSMSPRLGPVDGLSQRRGSELLTGSLTNPLPVDLLDAVLVYGNWSYLLPTRFRAGQRIESIESLRQKNFRWHLTKREIADNASKLAPWDVEMHDDWGRLTEILMFESSVGGKDYTGLANRALGGLDLSYVLAHGHAILYGRIAEPVLENEYTSERPTVSAARILLPVAPAVVPPGR